jgi:predicted membrane-bound spermidine synthase
MSFFLALAAAALGGFISLSYEILWYRAISIASGATAAAFGLLLGFYLLGVAAGAWIAGMRCRDPEARGDPRLLLRTARFFLIANGVGFLVLPCLAWFGSLGVWPAALVVVTIAAAMFGAVLPLISHFSVHPSWLAGRSVSYLYVANIIGSVAGSFLTGFVLLEVVPLRNVALILALLGYLVALALLVLSRPRRRDLTIGGGAIAVLALAATALTPPLFARFYESLVFGHQAAQHPPFRQVVENRSGVITVTPDGTVYGNGAYDGRLTTDLVDDRNLIVRAYAIAALHPAPRRALMIGMGGGAWAQVVANHPSLEELIVVEINPGYVDVIRDSPVVASLLDNPRVTVVIDDGRRWLNRNPDLRFDLIVANTSQHWRAHATHLLSVEFLKVVKRHLLPGGVYYFNTTYSHAALNTAMNVFPSGVLVINFAAVGDSVRFDRDRLRQVLVDYTIDGQPVLRPDHPAHRQRLDEVAALEVFYRDFVLQRSGSAGLVTDDNMLTEWYPSEESWQ